MKALDEVGAGMADCDANDFGSLMRDLAASATGNGMEIMSCAEDIDLSCYGIRAGKCVDDELIKKTFGIDVSHKKDPSQRKKCGCVVSRDIGMYDSCVFGCPYCYATQSFERAAENYKEHNLRSPSLLGWYDPETPRAEI